MKPAAVDVLVVGGGAAGLAAAAAATAHGAEVCLLERGRQLGGVLEQCIHPGFGLHRYREELTGPEFAHRLREELARTQADVHRDTEVIAVDADARRVVAVGPGGMLNLRPNAMVWAAGARERPLGALRIPGTRPAGVFVAGLAQRMVNMHGLLPGHKAVILGSGDIGLIMARRLHLEGVEVVSVLEIQPFPGGLLRNVVQCLEDFGIPLLLEHTVTTLHGRRRLEGVTVAEVDAQGRPRPDTEAFIEADTLILSVGLIPETELVPFLPRDEVNRGPSVNTHMQTQVPWVFSAGNCTVIYDVVDTVAGAGERAGAAAARYAKGALKAETTIPLVRGENVLHMVPQALSPGAENTLSLRVPRPLQRCAITVGGHVVTRQPGLRPSEMVEISLSDDLIGQLDGASEARVEVKPL